MIKTLAVIVGAVLQWSAPQAEPSALSLSQWVPQKGDIFVVDTKENMGYLIHPNGSFIADFVGSGQRDVISYGKFGSYDATTPEDVWRVKSTTIQKDKNIFGPTGLFLRMYAQGDTNPLEYEYTAFGLHDVGNSKELLANVDRYKSMGCILVRADLLKLLAAEYELHKDEGGFVVVTTYGFTGKGMKLLAAR